MKNQNDITIKEPPLRRLARSRRWQTLYTQAKEIGGIRLFENTTNFTPIQVLFLELLQIYHVLYTDLALKEEFISEEVIKDWIRADAYLYYRKQKKKKDDKSKSHNPIVDHQSSVPRIVFRRGK